MGKVIQISEEFDYFIKRWDNPEPTSLLIQAKDTKEGYIELTKEDVPKFCEELMRLAKVHLGLDEN